MGRERSSSGFNMIKFLVRSSLILAGTLLSSEAWTALDYPGDVYCLFSSLCLQQLQLKNKTKQQHYVTFVPTNTREIWYQFSHWLILSLWMRIVYLKNGMSLYTPKLGNYTFHWALSSHHGTITPNYTFKRISHHPFPVLDVWTRRLQQGGKGQDAVGTNRSRLITFR